MTHQRVSATRWSLAWLLALTLTLACGGQRPLDAEVVDDAAGWAEPPRVLVAPTPPSVAGRLKLSLLSTKVWLDTERLGPLRKLDYVALYARLRDRRGSEAGVHAASFELEVDATATTSDMLTLYWLSVHAGYRRAELITWAGRTTLCSIDCNTGADEGENALAAGHTVLIIRDHGISMWQGEQSNGEATRSVHAPERVLDAPWKWKDDVLEADVSRVCALGCSHLSTYLDPYMASGQLKRLLAILGRLRGAGAGGVVLELRNEAPPAPGNEGSAFRVSASGDSGRLPSQLIRAVLSRHMSEIYRCALVHLDRVGGARRYAWMTFHLVISERGGVTNIGVRGAELPADVLGCATKQLEALRFPPSGGSVRWPFAFPVYEERQ